jgi:hypothetical protein
MDDVSLFVNKLIKSAMMAFLLIFFFETTGHSERAAWDEEG